MTDVKEFGKAPAKLLTLTNNNGMEVALSNFGARIVKVVVPIAGEMTNVALGFDSAEEYLAIDTYVGAIVGPVAGRISKGKTTIDETEYHFTQNENDNTNHSGPNSLESFYWADQIENNSVTFTTEVKDEHNGFPGPIAIEVKYTLTEENEIILNYQAKSSKDTLFNPTNHVYFNLDGEFMKPINEQKIKIASEKFVELSEETLPTGKILAVANTPFDFREKAAFKQGFINGDKQTTVANGFDHPWLLEKAIPQVEAWNTAETLKLEMTTDRSSVVIFTYNGEAIDGKVTTHGAFTLEAQELPDANNVPGFGNIQLLAGETYTSKTTYKFIY